MQINIFKSCFVLVLILLGSGQVAAQRTFTLPPQTETDAIIGSDRKDFGGPYSQGYHHDFDLGPGISPCERIVSVALDIEILSYNENIPPGCSHNTTFYNIYYGCGLYNGMGGSCDEANNIDAPDFPPPSTNYSQTYFGAAEGFEFNGIFSADIVPVANTFCPGGADAINQGHVAYTYTITVTIETALDAAADPTFSNPGPLCENDAAVTLPTMSSEGITGSWSPATIDPSGGSNVTATFTPDAGQCANTTMLTVAVDAVTDPTFSNPGPLCENDAAVTLPTMSSEGITGSWSPAAIDPAGGIDVTATFTPDAGQCANTTMLTVAVDAVADPTFSNPGPLCENAAAVTLPTMSIEGITGSWSPATIDPSGGSSVTATFTPDAGQCANTTTLTVEVNAATNPTFINPGPLCNNDAAVTLPMFSNEGITGSWSPATVNPAIGIDVTATFTPDAGQCANTTTLTVEVNAATNPTFINPGPLCSNDAAVTLPMFSNEGITGSWSPATVNPAIGIDVTATFTPDAGQCANTTTLTVEVITPADPAFTLDQAMACAADQDVIITLSGGFDPAYQYTLGVDQATGFTITDTDASDGVLGINFSTAGNYQITLTTQNIADPTCTSSATETFTLTQPVGPPTLVCGDSGLDFLEFDWTDVGADSYTVNIITIPPGATTAEVGTNLTVTDLNAGESVTISVTAVQAGCPDLTSAEVTCIAESCPPVTPIITTPVDTFCVDGSAGLIDLTVDVPAAGTVMWFGPGVTGDQFNPAAAGPGFHTITVVYTEGNCDYPADFELGVVNTPNIGLVAVDGTEFCAGDVARFAPTGSLDPGTTFTWLLPAGAMVVSGDPMTFDTLTLNLGGAGAQSVRLAIATPFCGSDTLAADVTVNATPVPLTLECANVSFDQVGFVWSHPTASGFTVTVLSAPPGATIVENAGDLLATGLAEGESVTIRVVGTISGPCADVEQTLTCTAESCPGITVALDPVGPFCVDEDATVALNAVPMGSDGSGSLSYLTAPGVVGTDFVSTGLGVGTYEVIASFTEGSCTFNDTIEVVINALPTASFAFSTGPVCTDSIVGADAGAAQVGWSYEWVVPAADATVVNNSPTNISIAWASGGTQTVGLIVTDDNGCVSDTLLQTIAVTNPLPTPVIDCGVASLTSVAFDWAAIPGATGYRVSVDNGTPFTQDSTNLLVTGLTPDENVSIVVLALSSGPCGNSEPGTQDCAAESCPTITITGIADQDFCTGAPGNVVTLMATQMGGSGAGTFTFSGPGVTANAGVFTFDADAAGPGSHQVNVLYDESTCTAVDSFLMNVTQTPVSNFALNGGEGPLNVCAGDDFLAAYTGPLTVADGATFTWAFAGATETPLAAFENYTLNFATPGVYPLELTVTLNGCPSSTTVHEVTVDAPLTAPVITCTGSDLNSVTFSWGPVSGATGYELGDGTVLPDSQTSFTVTGLTPGQDTTITVTALSAGLCGNTIAVTSAPCSADDCPALALDTAGLMRQTCLENGNETIDLSTVLVTGGTGTGTYTFSGAGVTGETFDAAAAGGSEAGTVHTITIDYEEVGPCSFSGTFEITVYDRPTVAIMLAGPACINDGVQVIVSGANPIANADVTIDFDGGMVIPDGDPDDNVYLISWDTPGTKTVMASIVSPTSGCVSLPVSEDVVIEAPLAVPVVSCPAVAELESINFTWGAVAGAEGYEIIVNPGGTTTVGAATTSFLLDGLSPDTPVSISVIALSSGPCGNSQPGLGACATAPCPGGTVQAITQDADFCLDGTESAFLLEAELDQGTPSGPFVWSGTGVVDNGDGTYNFDPAGLGADAYVLTVNYLGEASCASTDAITIQLFDEPSSAFAAAANVICVGTETLVGVTGPVDPGATYFWDFAGAAQTAGPTAESYNLSWPVAGDYTVSLTVTANGCSTTSTDVITVDAPANAGSATGEELAFCAGATATVDLNTLLTGQDAGGTWTVSASSPSGVGGTDISTGTFGVSQLSAGDYIFAYTVTSGACQDAVTEVNLRLLPPPVVDAGPPRALTCTMGMATLDGSNSESGDGYTYRWFATDPNIVIMGGDQATLDVSQPGTYFLEVTNAIGCSATAEVEVAAETEAPVMEVEVSNISCFSADDGAIVVTSVSGGRAPYTFTLNGQERGQSTLFASLMAQEYNLQVTDANGCFSNLILDLTEPDELTVRLNFPGDSTTAAAGDEITLTASVNGGNPVDTLIWMPDSLNNGERTNGVTFTATETQMISVTVVDELGCSATDRELLFVRKDRRVYFPNAFSPNGDNINDIWFIGGDLDEIEFIDNFFIFNRWGEAVHTGGQVDVAGMPAGGDGSQFLPNDPAFGWDGTLRGRPLDPQVLVYTATVHFRDGEVIIYRGDFMLLK